MTAATEAAARGGEGAKDEAKVPQAAGALPGRAALVSASTPRREGRVRPLASAGWRVRPTLIDSVAPPMSMYIRLLEAALAQRASLGAETSSRDALEEVRRCRAELETGLPGGDVDTVSAVLALQVGYDVALLELAAVMGLESGPGRFEQTRT